MRWIAVAVLLCGCDALFQIDHLKDPRDDAGANADSTTIDGLVDAPRDGGPRRVRAVQVAQSLGDAQTTTLSLPMPQLAGDLNVVCISWVGASSALMQVTDDAGNLYANTSGTGISSSTNQVMYYAYNVKAGMNRLTVSFSTQVSIINIRFVEYTDIPTNDPKEGGQVAVNTGMTMTSAMLTVTQETLLVAGFVSSYPSISPGPNFDERIEQTFGYVEDRQVGPGSYSATAIQTNSGPYIAHIAAFAVVQD
jgi:hypothetical protein